MAEPVFLITGASSGIGAEIDVAWANAGFGAKRGFLEVGPPRVARTSVTEQRRFVETSQ
jgi:hypothetical protein